MWAASVCMHVCNPNNVAPQPELTLPLKASKCFLGRCPCIAALLHACFLCVPRVVSAPDTCRWRHLVRRPQAKGCIFRICVILRSLFFQHPEASCNTKPGPLLHT
uniref:Secreted protein n=1 Tax=Panagrellus redivivus TaxID=6233 RepID=A0A7E4V1H4_PANRE